MCNSFQTRILVTHKLSVLPEVDHVIVLRDGKVLEQGEFVINWLDIDIIHRLTCIFEVCI